MILCGYSFFEEDRLLKTLFLGFLIVLARCGDIFGRRSAFMIALIIFTIASLACGVAQTMTQL